MSGKIYLIQELDGALVEMAEQPYDSEDVLQTLLEKYPDLMAGDQINKRNPRRWQLVSREAKVPDGKDATNRWAVDHLFLDQDGIPTLVEVKRSSDTRIRREVVGQMLDYAANAVVYWSLDQIRAQFEANCKSKGENPDSKIEELIGENSEDEVDIDSFWEDVERNLQAGKVRLVFVADIIPPELQRIVEFLNEQMNPAEVLAVEVRQYEGQGVRTMVPQVIGQTAEAQQRKSTSRRPKRQWDEDSFFAEYLRRHGEIEANVARRILDWGKKVSTTIRWGFGAQSGSYSINILHRGYLNRVLLVYTYGGVEINFQYYKNHGPFASLDKRNQLREKLNQIPGVDIPEDGVTKRPSLKTQILAEGDNLERFIEIYDWVIEEIKAG